MDGNWREKCDVTKERTGMGSRSFVLFQQLVNWPLPNPLGGGVTLSGTECAIVQSCSNSRTGWGLFFCFFVFFTVFPCRGSRLRKFEHVLLGRFGTALRAWRRRFVLTSTHESAMLMLDMAWDLVMGHPGTARNSTYLVSCCLVDGVARVGSGKCVWSSAWARREPWVDAIAMTSWLD